MFRNRIVQTLDQQVESVWQDDYLRNVSNRVILTAENVWRSNNELLYPKQPVALEIGGAGGVTKRLRPEYIVTDIRKSEGVDVVADATNLPFIDGSFDVVYAVDVIHHITDLNDLFDEVNRVLKPGGIFFMREPYWGPLAQLIWRFVHPEDFSIKRLFKVDLRKDPMSGNQALAYALIKKTSVLPPNLIPKGMRLQRVGELTGIAFLLSGGATFRTKIPRTILIKLENWELKHPIWLKMFGFSTGIYLFRSRDSN